MMKRVLNPFKLVLAFLLIGITQVLYAQTPVQKYGQLKVTGNKITDQAGNAVQLRGMSMFWSNSSEGGPFYNTNTINWLRDDWCVDVIRVAMGVESLGGTAGYLSNPTGEYNKVKTVIDACIAKGIYVIVDFHSHNAEQQNQKDAAKTFFRQIAQAYGDKPNVMYETFNEPINQSWSTLRSFHNEMVAYIRQYDPDNIIICGTRSYSREVEEASQNKVTGTNIAYTLHYYAGGGNDHNSDLRGKVTNALNNGIAIFCTEYGTCDPSGNGGYNAGNSQTWWTFLDQNKIGHCNWSVCNKNETASILTSGTSAQNNWTTSQLTTSGKLVRDHLKSKCNTSTGSVTITSPTNNATINKGVSVTITATATVSSGGTVAKIEFYDGATLLNSDNSSPYSFSTSTLTPGTHTLTARSYDNTGVLLATSSPVVILIKGASDISSTGIIDMVENTTVTSEITGGVLGGSCASATTAAAVGIYWYDDVDPNTPFKATISRADGKITYLISQAANSYNIVGFGFGEYCNGNTRTKYALDLTQNAILKMTVSVPATNNAAIDLKFQLKDINGVVLAFDKNVLINGAVNQTDWYKYEIGFSKNHVAPNFVSLPKSKAESVNFEFNFKNALSIKNPNNPSFPRDINTNNTDFDFSKVVEVVILPVNAQDNGAPNYQPLALTDQTIIFSNIILGDVSLGSNICTTPKAPTAGSNPALCQGTTAAALKATPINGLELVWYGTSQTGGTGTTEATVPNTASAGSTTYYVSQRVPFSTCEGPRTALAMTVNASVTPSVTITNTTSTITSSVQNAGASPSYKWKKNGETIPSQTTSSLDLSSQGFVNGDIVSLEMTSAATCADPKTVISNEITIFVVGLEGNLSNANINVYPNPANNKISIEGLGEELNYYVSDLFGHLLMSGTSTSGIDIEYLQEGTYILNVNGHNFKIVKN